MHPKIVRTVLLAGLVAGCSGHPAYDGGRSPKMSDWDIYNRIQLGMSQPKVEKAVGKPHAPVSHGLALYGDPPVPGYDPDGSRAMPFNVIVVYSNKVVVSKELYSGYDVYIEGVYPLPFGDDERAKMPKNKGPIRNKEDGKAIKGVKP